MAVLLTRLEWKIAHPERMSRVNRRDAAWLQPDRSAQEHTSGFEPASGERHDKGRQHGGRCLQSSPQPEAGSGHSSYNGSRIRPAGSRLHYTA